MTVVGFETPDFDEARLYDIIGELKSVLDQHAVLLKQTEDPLFRALIYLCREWWIMWLMAGIHEAASGSDDDDIADALTARWGELEGEIVRLGGVDGFEKFLGWAQERSVDYLEPLYLRRNPRWQRADRQGPPAGHA